jgi:hypothetical protein
VIHIIDNMSQVDIFALNVIRCNKLRKIKIIFFEDALVSGIRDKFVLDTGPVYI